MKSKKIVFFIVLQLLNFISRKRSSSVLNNDDDRRNSSHQHLMLPPSHLTNNNYSSSNRSRSRSPHRSLHHHHSSSSSSLLNKNSLSSPPPPPPLHSSSSSSSSRKRNSPNTKPNLLDNSKSSHPSLPPPTSLPAVPLPPTFGSFDPLTLSIIERQRLSAAYASLFAAASQQNNYFPINMDPTTFRNNGSSSLFPNLDSSAMTAALMQREHFLNSLRLSQQQQNEQIIERERAAIASINKTSKPTNNVTKMEQTSPKSNEETPRISPKIAISPGSHSSTSSSSTSSKKAKHVKREKQSPSPSSIETKTSTTTTTIKEESNIESTPSISTTT